MTCRTANETETETVTPTRT